MTAPTKPEGGQSGSIWMRKYGPLPLWAYGLILFGVVAAWRIYSDQKSSSAASSTDTSTVNGGTSTTPPVVFQAYDYDYDVNNVSTPVTVPPGAGRHTPPVHVPVGHPSPPVTHPLPPNNGDLPPIGGTPVKVPTPTPVPTPVPTPAPAPAPAAPAGTWVTVAKWTASNTPWNSTISGIASHYGYGSNWGAVWNNSANDSLRARRKDPKLIQPGDKVFVPAK